MPTGLLRTIEELVPREAQQHLRVDGIRAHERPAVRQWLCGLLDRARLAQDRVRAPRARGARHAERVGGRRRAQAQEEGHGAEYAARGERRRLRAGTHGGGGGWSRRE